MCAGVASPIKIIDREDLTRKRIFITRRICFFPASSSFLTAKPLRFRMTKCNVVQTAVVAQFEIFGPCIGVVLSAAVFQAERRISHWPNLWEIPHAAEVRRVSG